MRRVIGSRSPQLPSDESCKNDAKAWPVVQYAGTDYVHTTYNEPASATTQSETQTLETFVPRLFVHPVQQPQVVVVQPPPERFPWTSFLQDLIQRCGIAHALSVLFTLSTS